MSDERFLRRCFQLARLGAGSVSPNPMVGAVLVQEGRIIGEGWHQRYGGPHAEVNCIAAVRPEDRPMIRSSTLYCSLEPCFHYGKTPPCVDLVLREGIPRVVVSNIDPNPKVGGQSLAKLRAAGVEVREGVLEAEGYALNRAFFTWIAQKRPYIHLKWAQSSDGFIGRAGERVAISGPPALRYVHRLRSESDAILVGFQTALTDNPRLDTRYYPGKNPLRIAFDRKGQLPPDHHLLDDSTATWLYAPERPGAWAQTRFLGKGGDITAIPDLLQHLSEAGRAILLVEGGAEVHREWLEAGYWDAITVIQNERPLRNGIAAPRIPAEAVLTEQLALGADRIFTYERVANV